MKKVISILLIMSIFLCFASCGKGSSEEVDGYLAQGEYIKALKASGLSLEQIKEYLINDAIRKERDLLNEDYPIPEVTGAGIKCFEQDENDFLLALCVHFKIDGEDIFILSSASEEDDGEWIFSTFACVLDDELIMNGEKSYDREKINSIKGVCEETLGSCSLSSSTISKINKAYKNNTIGKSIKDTDITFKQAIKILLYFHL